MKNFQNLLTQVSIINKKNNEILVATGGRFNMFRLLGVNHYENMHSAILAEFLNPKGSHGLKGRFLEAFVKQLTLPDSFKDFNCDNAKVITEASTENGRIDIFIYDNYGHALIIENKIYAGDQWEQLKRYDHFANQKYGKLNYKIFYLTPMGSAPSENSGGGVDYTQISYACNIINWLEQCVNLSARFPLVRETINQYINHLKQLTNQDMDKKNQEELVELLSKSDNIESALKISENINQLKEEIVKKMAKYVAEECSVEYIVDKGALGIGFFKNTWKEGAGIWFGVYKNISTYYSIKTVEARYGKAVPQRRIETLFDKSEDSFNPYGLGIVMDEHWIIINQLFIKMDNHTLANEIIIPKLRKVLNYLNEHPEIEDVLKLSTNLK
jgi:hypothetical protein